MDGNNASDCCELWERCLDIITKFKKHVNTKHRKNSRNLQSIQSCFSDGNGLARVEENDSNVTPV